MDTSSCLYLPGEKRPVDSTPHTAGAASSSGGIARGTTGIGGQASAAGGSDLKAGCGGTTPLVGASEPVIAETNEVVNQDTTSFSDLTAAQQLDNLASNIAQDLVHQASHTAAHVISQNEAAASAQTRQDNLEQSELVEQNQIKVTEEERFKQEQQPQQQQQQIFLQEEASTMSQQQVRIVQPGQVVQHQQPVLQQQGLQQQGVNQVKVIQSGTQQQQIQQQNSQEPAQTFQSQQIINVQKAPGHQQQFKPVDIQFQIGPGGVVVGGVVQGGGVQVQPSQGGFNHQQVVVQHKKGPAPQPPPKPTSPIKTNPPNQTPTQVPNQPLIRPNVQQIAFHSPKIQPVLPGQQQQEPAIVQQPAVRQQQVIVHQQQQPAMRQQPVVIQESMVQPVAQQPAQNAPQQRVIHQQQQPAIVQQSVVRQQPAVQQQQQQPAIQPVMAQQVHAQQPITVQTRPQQVQPSGGEPGVTVSTKRPLAVKQVIAETLTAEGMTDISEQTKPRQFYQETIIDSRAKTSLKMAPCILTDFFSELTPDGKRQLSYFLFLCFGATFLSSATELPALWMVGCVYLVSNIMFYALDM